jgi:23S rRNA 5-hydroxycytidine C2501 synthase
MTRIELLSPARDLECGIAAVNCGADAVYIGAERFGAREAAGNSLSDIETLARHAHKYWVRVYAAVNTLLRDDEMEDALRLIRGLYEAGVDGLIVQDTGLLECDLPPLPLIASTQMHNDTPEKVAFLEKVGFTRAILARELTLDGIRTIRERTSSIELEAFVHGSLCVGYSGQCVMSFAIGGRSANRGACGQPCRRRYRLSDDKGALLGDRHWLSLKDMNRSGRLKDLIDAGITAFKIEGRLKDREYVTNVTRRYRTELDRILAGSGMGRSSSGASAAAFTPDLEKTFNRGYTGYFLDGRTETVGRTETPKHLGEPVGEVVRVGADFFVLDSKPDLAAGDGIAFFDSGGVLDGTLVNRVTGESIFPDRMGGIRKGIRIHRNLDRRFIQSLGRAKAERRIGLRMTLAGSREALRLEVEDEDGNWIDRTLDVRAEPAQKPEAALETIRKQLSSLGGTDYVCEDVEIAADPVPFAPVSVWNRFRREALDALTTLREKNRPSVSIAIEPNDTPYPEKQLSFLGNVFNGKAEAFYRRHGVESIEPAAESGLDMAGRKVMTAKYCLRFELHRCTGTRRSAAPPPPWILEDEDGRKFKACFDCANCRMEIYYPE